MAEFPIRSEQQEIGDTAVREFEHCIPARWATNKSQSDYGWDVIVLISAADSKQVGEEFYVQLKGSRATEYILDSHFVSIPLKISTINFLNTRQMPVMLALCDVARSDKPIYWTWLSAALAEADKSSPNWANQESVTLRIPTSQLISEDIEQIETYIRSNARDKRLAAVMLEVLLPRNRRSSLNLPDALSIDESYVKATILPNISFSASLADTSESGESDSNRDQLHSVSILLRENKDIRAEEILNELAPDICQLSPRIQASFYNSRGVLALHRFQAKEANSFFAKAVELNPSEPKHATNLLISEYVINGYNVLPEDWRDRLRKVLADNPAFTPAVRIYSLVLARDEGLDSAEGFVKRSTAFTTDAPTLLTALAEAAEERGEIEKALSFVTAAENLGAHDAELLSVKALILFRKALSFTLPSDAGLHVDGYGPADMDIDTLIDAAEAFERACTALYDIGLPLWAETTFANAASALMMAQRPAAARKYCEAFLKTHPNSIMVSAALAMTLYHSDNPDEAIEHASSVYSATKDSTSFKNLLLTLLKAEEYERLLENIRERQNSGFSDHDEQALALHLASVALVELGEHDKAQVCIDQIRDSLNRPADAVAADIFLAQRSGMDKSQIVKMVKDAITSYPGHPILEADFIQAMLPVTSETAPDLIGHIIMLAQKRQLAMQEAAILGEAYFVSQRFSEAEKVFRAAAKRFPNSHEFTMHQAYALYELGRDEDAFVLLNTLIEKGRHSFAVYNNLGHLARITGRIDDAIKLFELALGKTKKVADRAELHCILFELHKRKGDSVKKQLWHVVQYGKMCGDDPEAEARYLMMFLVASLPLKQLDDDDLKVWVSEFQERQRKFSTTHPRFHSLMTLQAPEGLSREEAAYWLFTEVASMTLSINLVRNSIAIRMREGTWPLATRADLLGANSLCDYWQHCTQSADPEHALYIFSAPLNLDEEVQAVCLKSAVCVDITTLLTLNLLNILDDVLAAFDHWVLAAGTREALERDSISITSSQPDAARLTEWLIRNRKKIRARKLLGDAQKEVELGGYQLKGGIWIQSEAPISSLIGKGVGETLLLAKQLNIPLYSDEALIRIWGKQNYSIPSFSTIALLRRLRQESRLSLTNETSLLVKLVKHNYRYIPFGHEQLQEAFSDLLRQNPNPTSTDMAGHELLGPLLREFAELKLEELSLLRVAAEWWIDVAVNENISDKTRTEVVTTLTFRLSERVKDSVLSEVSPKKVLMRRSLIWAMLLVMSHGKDKSLLPRCWTAIRGAAEALLQDEKTYNQCFREYVPQLLYRILRHEKGMQLVNALIEIPEVLPAPERGIGEQLLLRLAKRDRLVQ